MLCKFLKVSEKKMLSEPEINECVFTECTPVCTEIKECVVHPERRLGRSAGSGY